MSSKRAAKRRVPWIWVAVLVILVAFLAVSFTRNMVGGVGIGDPLPGVELRTLGGTSALLDDWRGEPLILRFSSATCTYCNRDFPTLDAMQAQLGDGIRVVAIQVADTPESVRSALMGQVPEVPVLIDPRAELTQSLGVRALPAVAFVTARGTLSSLVFGEVTQVDIVRHARTAAMGGPDMTDTLRRVSHQIRCRECEGRSVWESDAASSIQMRIEIEQRLLAGERPDEVVENLRTLYGDWILMAPPVEGVAALAWIFPAGGLLIGVIAWIGFLRRRSGGQGTKTHGADDPSADAAARGELERRVKDYM